MKIKIQEKFQRRNHQITTKSCARASQKSQMNIPSDKKATTVIYQESIENPYNVTSFKKK